MNVAVKPGTRGPLESRLWPRINKTSTCWLWTGSTDSQGYGQIMRDGRLLMAHRVVWELLVGPIPDGLTLDHLCRVTRCCRPDHLEPVTHRVNCLRGTSPWASGARKTHCPKGHPYDETNTRLYRGRRFCRTCSGARNA